MKLASQKRPMLCKIQKTGKKVQDTEKLCFVRSHKHAVFSGASSNESLETEYDLLN